jgi:hypothetical protein
VLLRLLRGQAKLVRSVDLDARLQLALLGEVVFDYTESLDHEIVQEIAMVTILSQSLNALIRLLCDRVALASPQLSSALNLVNAQVYIRSSFLKMQLQVRLFCVYDHTLSYERWGGNVNGVFSTITQEPVTAQDMVRVWTAVMGDALVHEIDAAFLSAGLHDTAIQRTDGPPLSYAQLEAVLLCGLIDRGVVAVPNEW